MASAEYDTRGMIQNVLGYANFSSGVSDPQFLQDLNHLYAQVEGISNESSPDESKSNWLAVRQQLEQSLEELTRSNPTFSNADQARAVIGLVFDKILPLYLEYHEDLLFHHTERTLFRPLFVGRIFEAVLKVGGPWKDVDRICREALTCLNDYVGHRPVATLENRKLEPYEHEWVRPIPIYIQGACIEHGRYQELVARSLELLDGTDETILREACFDLQQMEELAIDPRGCDFDHPAGKRPNYLFGHWDEHQIDQRGNYCRFVLRDVTLDSLMYRVENPEEVSSDELLSEAATVLAGTILMASGISGNGPGAHDSTTTLGTLLPQVAAFRDRFYEQQLQQLKSHHRQRLEIEMQQRRQPFGGARQDLNSRLARRRALQLQHVYLAKLFARMGYPEASTRQTMVVPVSSARMMCQIDCELMATKRSLSQERLSTALDHLNHASSILLRAIGCGAVIDPWNILGFGANYSLFPALENSIHDVRADELIDLMRQFFALYGRLWSEAAAQNEQALCKNIADDFQQMTDWWHPFAVHEVSSVDGFKSQQVYVAAERASHALGLWHQGGASTGDIGFWAPHAEVFDSAQAFSRVVSALLDRDDCVASMSLLVYWLSQASRVGLGQGEESFHALAFRWLGQVKQSATTADDRWRMIQKFFDYLEANANEYWEVPEFDLATEIPTTEKRDTEISSDPEDADDDQEEGLYQAAYEEVVFRDSTDDGMEGSIYDPDHSTEVELDERSRHLADRLKFIEGISHLWKSAAWGKDELSKETGVERISSLRQWFKNILNKRKGLLRLIHSVHCFSIPTPSLSQESMLQYDHQRLLKEMLLETAIKTCVETCDATRFVLAALIAADASPLDSLEQDDLDLLNVAEIKGAQIASTVLLGKSDQIEVQWDEFITILKDQTLLYVPLARRGDPRKIVVARMHQRLIENLLRWLPRLGFLRITCQLVEIARQMERNQPAGRSAVTEFDSLFDVGLRALVESIVNSAKTWNSQVDDGENLVASLEILTQLMLRSWLSHSKTLRLSVLERVADSKAWDTLVEFIQQYGRDLFTQGFLGLGNLRAIMHQGPGRWLDRLVEGDQDTELLLVRDLERGVHRDQAVECLTIAIEAVAENYGEYRDYNSSTIQSDRGEMLYTLLDFLRLRVEYDRVTWNLRPVVLAHEILVSHQRNLDAEIWRRALAERTQERAQVFLTRVAELQEKHAMQMPTVVDRLKGRFMKPLVIDRLRALIGPAIQESTATECQTSFDLLEQEILALAEEPSGVGLDVPEWLVELNDEVERIQAGLLRGSGASEMDSLIEKVILSCTEIQQQLSEGLNATTDDEGEE
jgi:hypothetical protein